MINSISLTFYNDSSRPKRINSDFGTRIGSYIPLKIIISHKRKSKIFFLYEKLDKISKENFKNDDDFKIIPRIRHDFD